MEAYLITGLAALGSGLVVGAVVFLIMKRRCQVVQSAAELNTAVIQTSLDSRVKEVENLNFRVHELQERLNVKEENLQGLMIKEASLETRTDQMHEGVQKMEARITEMQQENQRLQQANVVGRERISELEASLGEQQKHHKEKLALLEEAREKMNLEFKSIAGEIFESKQKTFKSESKEQLETLLSPLSQRIKDFEKRVEDTYNQEARERHSLIQEVKTLQDLNARISKDAINLTNALKGESKTQGAWGEVILERVLEKSGLQKGREYEVQVAMRNDDGKRYQPDVVVHLPEEKDVVIDSKVSLTAYERYCSAESEEECQAALSAHIQSLRQHLKQLAQKDYHNLDGLRSLDFVLMFVPIEAAFGLAVQHDNDLFADAFERNIVIVAPTTLLATLRTIQNIWRYEHQNQNAQEIANRAGALYDKFVNFVSDLENIGARIDATQTAYQDAHNKLVSGRGNLVRRAESMKELGAKASKSLPPQLVEMPAVEGRKSG